MTNNKTGIFNTEVDQQKINQLTSTLAGALAMIQQLSGGAEQTWPLNKLRNLVDALLREVPYLGYPLDSLNVFRGRLMSSRMELSATSEFSYVPKDQSRKAGRCHSPGKTIFYGSLNIETVLSELTPEAGDFIHIGIANIKPNNILRASAIGEIDHSRRYGTPLVGGVDGYQRLQNILTSMHSDKHARVLLVDAFFADLYSRPAFKPRDYKITSILADLLLESDLIDSFFYPSVANRGGLNIAIKPDGFDRAMEWKEFMILEITDYLGYGIYGQKIHAKSSGVKDGIINW